MVTNVSFALLDAAVVAGRGEEPVVGTWTHARLLEEVAAIGGVLRHLGVGLGVPVWVAPEDDVDAVVAALAIARIGGVVRTTDHPDVPVVVTSAGRDVPRDGRMRLLRGRPGDEPVQEPDLDWNVMLRAGRTDPSACEVLEPGTAYSPERTVAEQVAVLAATSAPYEPAELRALLRA
jgi:hypothetical protein